MARKCIAAIIALLVFATSSFARVPTEQLADRFREGQQLFETLLRQRDNEVRRIMGDATLSSREKQQAIRSLQEDFLRRSREIHLNYREPFVQRVIAEANAELPDGKKIKRGLGSDIYLRDEKTGKVLRDARGRKIINPKHRGWQGDLDLGGDPLAVDRLEKHFNRYGVNVSSDMMNAPGYRDFNSVEVTINLKGKPGSGKLEKPGSSAHQGQVLMDAFSKETYVSVEMRKNQAGKKLVETNDHIKKAISGFRASPEHLVSAEGEAVLQGMSKGTLKSIGSGNVDDDQIRKILDEAGYEGGVDQYKKQLADLKAGHLAPGVGLDGKNAGAFQLASRKVTEQAVENARRIADKEFADKRKRIAELKKRAESAPQGSDSQKRIEKVVEYYEAEIIDSKVRIKETTRANLERLNGGNYDTFYERSHSISGAAEGIRIPSKPKTSRINAIKEGLKPGLLDIAGYGMSAYSVYDTWQKHKKGEISQNEAVIDVAGEVVDTGFGVVVDVGTAAAATGATSTGAVGAVATMAAPLVVSAAAGYAVTEASKEGLKLAAALRNEEISSRIAGAKIQETVNTFKIRANELLKLGKMTGDWRYFAQANDITYKLDNMATVTGDKSFSDASWAIFSQIEQVRSSLEKKYGVSIYALKEKMESERKKVQKIAMEKPGKQLTPQAFTAPVPGTAPATEAPGSEAPSDTKSKQPEPVTRQTASIATSEPGMGPQPATTASERPAPKAQSPSSKSSLSPQRIASCRQILNRWSQARKGMKEAERSFFTMHKDMMARFSEKYVYPLKAYKRKLDKRESDIRAMIKKAKAMRAAAKTRADLDAYRAFASRTIKLNRTYRADVTAYNKKARRGNKFIAFANGLASKDCGYQVVSFKGSWPVREGIVRYDDKAAMRHCKAINDAVMVINGAKSSLATNYCLDQNNRLLAGIWPEQKQRKAVANHLSGSGKLAKAGGTTSKKKRKKPPRIMRCTFAEKWKFADLKKSVMESPYHDQCVKENQGRQTGGIGAEVQDCVLEKHCLDYKTPQQRGCYCNDAERQALSRAGYS